MPDGNFPSEPFVLPINQTITLTVGEVGNDCKSFRIADLNVSVAGVTGNTAIITPVTQEAEYVMECMDAAGNQIYYSRVGFVPENVIEIPTYYLNTTEHGFREPLILPIEEDVRIVLGRVTSRCTTFYIVGQNVWESTGFGEFFTLDPLEAGQYTMGCADENGMVLFTGTIGVHDS